MNSNQKLSYDLVITESLCSCVDFQVMSSFFAMTAIHWLVSNAWAMQIYEKFEIFHLKSENQRWNHTASTESVLLSAMQSKHSFAL